MCLWCDTEVKCLFSAEKQSGGGEIWQETSQQQDSVCLHWAVRHPEGTPGPQEQGEDADVNLSNHVQSHMILKRCACSFLHAALCLHQAFLELSSHEEALDMVNYYEQHPVSLYGKPITFYLSKRLMVIEVTAAVTQYLDNKTKL